MKTLLIALVGLFLSVTLTSADEPTTAPSVSMIADVTNGSIEIAGKKFAFGASPDALLDQLGKPELDDDEDGDRTIGYKKSLGFAAYAWKGKLNGFTFYLRPALGDKVEAGSANVKTVEGIGINSTREQIENAYGKPETVEDLGKVIGLTYAKAVFFLDKDGLFMIGMMDGL